jgi:hypothetical protein
MTPDQPQVTTAIDALTGGVRVSWILPNTNGDAVSKYLVEIK